MTDQFCRTTMLLGEQSMDRLAKSKVLVFGLGGVGGHAVEALVRSGVGTIGLVDGDTVDLSNLNRQIIATHKTVGKSKVKVCAKRVRDINPKAVVHCYDLFFDRQNSHSIDLKQYDYIIDAIDTVSSKLELIRLAYEYGVPIISCLGTGNKLRPQMLEVADIYDTSTCPLARVMRSELRKLNIPALKVVYSQETPLVPNSLDTVTHRRTVPGSTSFVPATAGLLLASEVILWLCG